MQKFKFIDFMVVELRFFKKNKKNMAKMWKALFEMLHMFSIMYANTKESTCANFGRLFELN